MRHTARLEGATGLGCWWSPRSHRAWRVAEHGGGRRLRRASRLGPGVRPSAPSPAAKSASQRFAVIADAAFAVADVATVILASTAATTALAAATAATAATTTAATTNNATTASANGAIVVVAPLLQFLLLFLLLLLLRLQILVVIVVVETAETTEATGFVASAVFFAVTQPAFAIIRRPVSTQRLLSKFAAFAPRAPLRRQPRRPGEAR